MKTVLWGGQPFIKCPTCGQHLYVTEWMADDVDMKGSRVIRCHVCTEQMDIRAADGTEDNERPDLEVVP